MIAAMIERSFLRLNVRSDVRPTRVVVSANQHRAPPLQRTVVTGDDEDNLAFWARVLAAARSVAGRIDPDDPWCGTGGGTITFHYDASVSEEIYRFLDERANFVATMQQWLRDPTQPRRCRAFAVKFFRAANADPAAIVQ